MNRRAVSTSSPSAPGGTGLLLVLSLAAASCRAVPPQEINERYRNELEQRETEYQIKRGDALAIRLFGAEAGTQPGTQFNQNLLVLSDGRTDPFFMDNPVVVGKTVAQLKEEVKSFYARQINNPQVSIQVTPAGEVIFLRGQVNKPGTQPYTHRMTLAQAIANAEGYKVTASADEVILKRSYRNHRRPDRFVVSLYDTSEEVLLLPNDDIMVDPTTWILIRDYLQEYVYGFLPISYLQSALFALAP